MEDLTSRINQILNDPQSMQLIQNMAQNLGLNPAAPPAEAQSMVPAPASSQAPAAAKAAENGGIDINQLAGMLGQLGLGQQNQSQPPAPPPIDLNTMMQIQKAMQLFTNGNKSVDLLRSLRPLLSQRRQRKVDDAIRIMQLIQMLPMLKESGLFGSGGGLL